MSDLADRLELVKRVLLQADSDYTQESINDVDEAITAITTLQSNPSGEVGELIERLTWAHDRDALFREATTQLRAQAECIKELEDRVDQLEGTHLVAWAHQELGNMGEGGEG